MRTNIDLDDKLVKEAMRISDYRTKREVVNAALLELVKRLRRKKDFDSITDCTKLKSYKFS